MDTPTPQQQTPPEVTVKPQEIKEQIPQKSNFLVILLSTLLFICIVVALFFAFQTQKLVKELTNLKNQTPLPVVSNSPIFEPGLEPEVVPTNSDVSDWLSYTDLNSGINFKYPKTVLLNDGLKGSDKLNITFRVKDLNNYIDDPMGYSLETALSDKQSLLKGEFGGCEVTLSIH